MQPGTLRVPKADAERPLRHSFAARGNDHGLASGQCLATTKSFGNLKVQSMPPWLKSLTRLATSPPHNGTAPPQPESTEMYCSPSISQVTGEPSTPEPVWNSQTFSPVLALNACRKPSGVPVKTRLPLVVNTPPQS